MLEQVIKTGKGNGSMMGKMLTRPRFEYSEWMDLFLSYLKKFWLDRYDELVKAITNEEGPWNSCDDGPEDVNGWPSHCLLKVNNKAFMTEVVRKFMATHKSISDDPVVGVFTKLLGKAQEWVSSRKKDWKNVFVQMWYYVFCQSNTEFLQLEFADENDRPESLMFGVNAGRITHEDDELAVREVPDDWGSGRDVTDEDMYDILDAACYGFVDAAIRYYKTTEEQAARVTSEFSRLMTVLRNAILDDEDLPEDNHILPSACPAMFPPLLFEACLSYKRKIENIPGADEDDE
jgi:hypothetical protein